MTGIIRRKFNFFAFSLLFILGTTLISGVLSQNEVKEENGTAIHAGFRADRRPSFWTKSTNNLRASTTLRVYKPYGNMTKLQKRIVSTHDNLQYTTENPSVELQRRVKSKNYQIREGTRENTTFETTTTHKNDIEEGIIKDESFIGFKEFASQLINDTAKLFTEKNGQPRSYSGDEPAQHQLWDDKDQTYHASTFGAADYEPSSFHHHYIPSPPLHYYPPPKKDDTLLTKVAVIALLKLILAKLKAIGFLKLMFLFMMKIPVLFFKFLFVLKSFKLLKLVSIPFIMASFAAPFLPLLPFIAPLLLAPLFFAPLLFPLLLPLLFFLPIVPVSTPQNPPMNTRKRREVTLDTPVEDPNLNETKARHLRNRIRPASVENRKIREFSGKWNQYEDKEESANVLALIQKIVDSHNCIERVACELAAQNDSKIYETAIIWALEKVRKFASPKVRRKIERYSEAYKTGTTRHSSDYCQSKFYCQKPKILLVQGKSKYSVF